MSILDELTDYILITLYAASWFFDYTIIQLCVLYVSAFFVIIAGLQLDRSEKTPDDKASFYRIYWLNWWLLRLATVLLFWDLFQGHEVTFGFGVFFSILFSFGIVILTGFIFYYKTKLEKAET